MAVESLGMIEVRGFLGAVVAADAALKAANVDLQDATITRGGLVTVLLTGDVAAVNAAVDAGVSSIENMGCLISNYVIARMDEQTNQMTMPPAPRGPKKIVTKPASETKVTATDAATPDEPAADKSSSDDVQNATVSPSKNSSVEDDKSIGTDTVKSIPSVEKTEKSQAETTKKAITDDKNTWVTDKQKLENMRVVDLRKQAYRMNIKTLTKKQIKMGNKRTLVQAILDDLQRRNDI